MKVWMLAGIFAVGGVFLYRAKTRTDYCSNVCEAARTCHFLLVEPCEANCDRGHREIVIPADCDALKTNVNKAGYLW